MMFHNFFNTDNYISEKYWKAIKLAVAVACIRIKPSDLSGKEFTVQLQFQFWENLFKYSSKPRKKLDMFLLSNHNVSNKKTENVSVDLHSGLHTGSLLNCFSKFIAIKPYLLNCYEDRTSFELNSIGSRLVDTCVSMIECIKYTTCQNHHRYTQLLCCGNLLFSSIICLCEAIQFLELNLETKTLAKVINSHYINRLVNESIELISLLCVSLMEASQCQIKNFFFSILNKLAECKTLQIIIAKQLLYWIELVKKELILSMAGKSICNEKCFIYLNNISYPLQLMDTILLSLLQNLKSTTRKCSIQYLSSENLVKRRIDCNFDYGFLVCAKEQLETNIHFYSSSYPIFANYLFRLGYILLELLKDL